MNNLDLFCFTSVARTQSFSITARELRISQQAVSKHIKAMEKELGFQLFFRDAGSVMLTKAGELMLQYFEERNDLIEDLQKHFPRHGSDREFTIGCSQWIGCPDWFADRIRHFRQTHKDVSVHLLDLDAEEAFEAIKSGTLDMLLTSRYMAGNLPVPWKCFPMVSMPLYIIRSRHASYEKDQLSLYPFYAPSARETTEQALCLRVRKICQKLGFSPQNILPCHDMGTVILNILLNHGITLGAYADYENSGKDYLFERTELYVDTVLYVPDRQKEPFAEAFSQMQK